MIKKIIALVMIGALLIGVLKRHIFWVIGFIVCLYLVRLIADLFWWGKDNGKW